MLGGVGLAKQFKGTHESAFYEFITNSTFKILTDSSISGITLVATLNDEAESPYVSLDVDESSFMTSVKKLLIKIMPSITSFNKDVKKVASKTAPLTSSAITPLSSIHVEYDKLSSKLGAITRMNVNDRYNGVVEINSYSNVLKECEIQKNIYRQSILNNKLPLIPVCPAVLYLENPVGDSERFKSIIKGKLVPRTGRTTEQDEDELFQYLNVSIDELYNTLKIVPIDETPKFSIIVMELLDGYEPMKDVVISEYGAIEKFPIDSYLIPLIDVELFRMHLMGYFHGDLHLGNIMFNKDKDYLSGHKGKAIIIDFGRTTNDVSLIPEKCKTRTNAMITPDCLSTEKVHNGDVNKVTVKLASKLSDIQTKNNEKLAKVSDKLLYPDKDFIESLKEYVETRVYRGGGDGDGELDVNYLREILYGMLMQNDTPETFDLLAYLNNLSQSNSLEAPAMVYDTPTNIINTTTSFQQPITVTSGGKKTNKKHKKTNKKHKKTNKKHKKTNKKHK